MAKDTYNIKIVDQWNRPIIFAKGKNKDELRKVMNVFFKKI